MDRHYIRDNGVIERYLAGALTADEEQAFEEVYLGDPEILDQIEAAERLRDGIKGLGAAGRLERLRSPAPWRRMLASPRYATAASMLLAVSLTFSTVLYRENRNLREDGVLATSMITRLVPLESVRGGNAIEISAPERRRTDRAATGCRYSCVRHVSWSADTTRRRTVRGNLEPCRPRATVRNENDLDRRIRSRAAARRLRNPARRPDERLARRTFRRDRAHAAEGGPPGLSCTGANPMSAGK